MFDLILSIGVRLASGAVAIGWLLSIIGQLNARGYLCAGIPTLLLIALSLRGAVSTALRVSAAHSLIHWWKRRRILPLIYVATAVLVIAGSILHEPNNYDGLACRIPRVLFWLNAERWHWVDSPFGQINYMMPNYEWLTVPLFLATGGFHGAVVINWICFLFLPSLFFSLLITFGAARRFAYEWMWVLPSAYLITMQAGSIGNDLLGMTSILAALHFARQFAVSGGRKSYLFDALLAGGFCTGVKICNLPLAGFALILLLENLQLVRARIAVFALATTSGMTVSGLIPLALNFVHTGTILGAPTGTDQTTNFAAGLVANILMLLASCIAPPVFLRSHQITMALEQSLGSAAGWIHSNYARFTLYLNELPQEEGSGLGLGITMALAISAVLYFKYRHRQQRASGGMSRARQVAWNAWLIFGLVVLLGRLGTGPHISRELLPWYPVALAPLLGLIGCAQIPHTRLWRVAAPLVSLSVVPVLLLTPSRPLIPPATLVRLAQKSGLPAETVERLSVVYNVYANRPDPFGEIKNAVPANGRVLGLVSDADEPTAGWFKPFGSRRLIYLTSEEKVAAARENGVQFVVIQESSCWKYFNMDSQTWMKWQQARPIVSRDIRILAAQPPWRYTLAIFETKRAARLKRQQNSRNDRAERAQ